MGFGVSACAQTAVDGAVSGSVVDAGGAVVSGARVSFRTGAVELEPQIATDSQGEFFVPRVSPGDYDLTIDAPEFAPVTLHVLVELGAVTQVPVHLHLAGIATSVSVAADESAGGVAAEAPVEVASVVTPEEIDRLPLNGGRWQTFALLTPTVRWTHKAMGG